MIDDETIAALREGLRGRGSVTFMGPDGKRLFLVASVNLHLEERGLLVAYEGHGAYFWDLQRPVNTFLLAGAGFDITVAPELADLLNRLLGPQGQTDAERLVITERKTDGGQ